MTDAKIIELREAGLPRLTFADVMKITEGELTAEQLAELDAYFRLFTRVKLDEGKAGVLCPGCGEYLVRGDAISNVLQGATFEWGMANGEGGCRECGYPARAYHRNVAGVIEFLNTVLAVHPEELFTTAERAAAAEEEAADFARENEERRQAEDGNPRQKGDDDGVEYADPRDERDERLL